MQAYTRGRGELVCLPSMHLNMQERWQRAAPAAVEPLCDVQRQGHLVTGGPEGACSGSYRSWC